MAFWKKGVLERGLEEILGPDGLLSHRVDTACYGFDSSGMESEPQFVALPQDATQVSRLAKLCNGLGVPITPRGAGSSTTGSAVPVSGGVVLCFSRMDRILEIDPVELTARVQPGVVTGVLQREVEKVGLFYPPDPASLNFCTIGGNVATGAGGARAVKYGVTRDYVRSLKVVLSDGSLVDTGAGTSKGVVGYDLTRLMVGSEGTLGMTVEVLLRLVPRPEAVGTIGAFFSSVEDAVDAVTCLFRNAVLPRCAEFLDDRTLAAISSSLPFETSEDARAFLLLEVDGDEASVKAQIGTVRACLEGAGALYFKEADEGEEREQLWQARRGVSPRLKALGFENKVSEDICVPRKSIKDMLLFLRGCERHWPVKIFSFGHMGDGNIHVNLLFNSSELAGPDLHKLVCQIMKSTVELGGTISGEHGIGISKMDFLDLDLSDRVIGLEKQIKKVFDPKGILNPGKIFKD